jgi:multidrug transporter EmrE-like cation transporter
MNNLSIALLLITVSQIITYLQLQGQFFSGWMKSNPWLISLIGVPISYTLIQYTKRSAAYFNGEVWPGRLIGFAVGVIVFAVLSYFIFKEPVSIKTGICLLLAIAIVLIQIFA